MLWSWVLPNIPTCSVSGVAWKQCHVSEKCYGSGFAPFSHLLCEWSRWKKCHVSEKCHVSGFAPCPHLLCEWCPLKKNAMLAWKCHGSGFAPYPHLLCEWCRLKNGNVGEKCHVNGFALPHIPNCSVSGVAWKKCHVSEKCYGRGFCSISPHALWVVAGKNAMFVKNAMLVVLLHVPAVLDGGWFWYGVGYCRDCLVRRLAQPWADLPRYPFGITCHSHSHVIIVVVIALWQWPCRSITLKTDMLADVCKNMSTAIGQLNFWVTLC